jgi:hypothetical protein
MSVQYRIETGVSKFTVKAFAGGVLSALAHNPTFAVRQYEGTADIDLESGSNASLRLTISGASLELIDDVSNRDRQEIESIMRDQVLEVSKFPTISYDSPVGYVCETEWPGAVRNRIGRHAESPRGHAQAAGECPRDRWPLDNAGVR